MKKKYTNILLVLVILGIWGYIVNVVFHPFGEEEEWNEVVQAPMPKKQNKERVKYELNLDYPDPFRVKMYNSRTPVPAKPQTAARKAVIQPKPMKPIVWPSIEYKGRIKNHSTQANIAVLKIDGRNYRLTTNELANEVLIKSIWKDSIALAYESQTKVYYLQ